MISETVKKYKEEGDKKKEVFDIFSKGNLERRTVVSI